MIIINLLLILIGLLLSALVLTIGASYYVAPVRQVKVVRFISLFASVVGFLIGAVLWVIFDNLLGNQFVYRVSCLSIYNFSFTLGLDGFSLVFLMLTLFIMPICVVAA